MTLAFSTQLNKVPTYFVPKILDGLYFNLLIDKEQYSNLSLNFGGAKKHQDLWKKEHILKIHTIRVDEKNNWKEGNLIHFVINNRTKNRYQFAPVVKCISTQKIKIHYWHNTKTEEFDLPEVYIDDKVLRKKQIEALAINDGFENSKAFFAYFNTNFTGKIIHWTNTRY